MNRRWPCFLATLLLLAADTLAAQGLMPEFPGRYGFSVAAVHPHSDDLKLPSLASYFTGFGMLSRRMQLVAELPYAYGKYDEPSETSTMLGNLYLGVRSTNAPVSTEFGVRLPTAATGARAAYLGSISDLSRIEAFTPELASASAAVRLQSEGMTGLATAVVAGPSVWWYHGDDQERDPVELLLTYAFEPAYQSPRMRAGMRLLGRWAATDDAAFLDRFRHQVGLFGDFAAGRVRPGVHLDVPLDQWARDRIDWLLGVRITIAGAPIVQN